MANPATTHGARPFTYADLGAMPDDGYRREISSGSLIVTPAPNTGHQRVAPRLSAAPLAAYWIVDPVDPSLLALRLEGDGYRVEAEVTAEEAFVTDWPFPVRVVPTELRR